MSEAVIAAPYRTLSRVIRAAFHHIEKGKKARRFPSIYFWSGGIMSTDGQSLLSWSPSKNSDGTVSTHNWSFVGDPVLLNGIQLRDALVHIDKLTAKGNKISVDNVATIVTSNSMFSVSIDDLSCSGTVERDLSFPFEMCLGYVNGTAIGEPEKTPVYEPTGLMPGMLIKIGQSFEEYADSMPFTMHWTGTLSAMKFTVEISSGTLTVCAMPARV